MWSYVVWGGARGSRMHDACLLRFCLVVLFGGLNGWMWLCACLCVHTHIPTWRQSKKGMIGSWCTWVWSPRTKFVILHHTHISRYHQKASCTLLISWFRHFSCNVTTTQKMSERWSKRTRWPISKAHLSDDIFLHHLLQRHQCDKW